MRSTTSARAGRYDEALAYFRDEYALNARIKRYRKPYVALIDGIVMGGGVGVSVHGSHRVAGDKFVFAMPEVGIGFFPDIGATWFLPRLPGELGTYCALTGERLDAADGTRPASPPTGFPRRGFPTCSRRCAARSRSMRCSARSREPAGKGPGMARRCAPIRDRPPVQGRPGRGHSGRARCRGGRGGADAAFASAAAALMRTKSPTSLKIALAQMRRGATLDFAECMRTEFRIVSRVVRGHDLYEGVRAVIVDKDQAPRWQPPTLEAVSDAEVERHFAPLASELELP